MTVENGKPEEQVAEDALEEALEQDREQAPEQKAEQETIEDFLLNEEGGIAIDDEAPQAAASEQTIDQQLLQQVEAMTGQVAQAKDQTLRAHAEMQNIKRRAQQDVEKAHKFALDKFVDSLIPVIDSLEKGIESAEKDEGRHEAILEGMNLTLKQFLGAFEKAGVVQVDPTGQPFDPNFHQAMSMVPNPDMEPNMVMDTFQKGYTLNNRLVRPAMVVVSK